MTTTIPGAVNALVALVTTAVGDKAAVYDGPNNITEDAYVLVCRNLNGPAIEMHQAPAGPAANMIEHFTIHNSLSVESGDQDFASLRQEAFELFDLIVTALARDPKLGGAVMKAVPAMTSVEIELASADIVTISFTVDCEGMRNRV